MMISKVKPLHNKVEETTAAIDNAEHKMNILANKRKVCYEIYVVTYLNWELSVTEGHSELLHSSGSGVHLHPQCIIQFGGITF